MDHDHITQASKGSVFAANVNAQRRWFNVEDIQFEANDEPDVIGVISEETVLDIRLGSMSDQGSLHLCDGMEELTRDISKFVVDSLQRADAYARLNIPNMKAVIVTGVAGSGKKSVVRASCRKAGLHAFPLSLARALSDREVMESHQATSLSHICTVFDKALQSAPSAVILQDLDIIAKDRGVDSTLQSNTVSILSREIERASQANNVSMGIKWTWSSTRSLNRARLPEVFQKQDLIQHEFHISIPVKYVVLVQFILKQLGIILLT
ncbi:hypothetical protein BGX34_003800 [Mortierella sp. NVP85]|nr:hypothetical protein BGX34_003800 [Mortierella sp. NVP85]